MKTNYKDISKKIAPFVSIAHAELLTLKAGSNLIEGQSYKITDHQTIYSQPVTSIVKTKPIEALVVTALSNSELSVEAYSPTYPQDIIKYDIDDIETEEAVFSQNIDVVGNSSNGVNGFSSVTGWNTATYPILYVSIRFISDGESWIYGSEADRINETNLLGVFFTDGNLDTGLTLGGSITNVESSKTNNLDTFNVVYLNSKAPRKGRIYERKDTITGNSTGFDFRNVFYMRAKCNHAAWNAGTNYGIKALVRVPNVAIYVSLVANNLNHPVEDSDYWVRTLDLSITEYLGWSSSCNLVSFDLTDTIEVPAFWILGEENNSSGLIVGATNTGMGFKDITIAPSYQSEEDNEYWGGSDTVYSNYLNTVFVLLVNADWEARSGGIKVISEYEPENELSGISGNNTLFYSNMRNSTLIINDNIGDINVVECPYLKLQQNLIHSGIFKNSSVGVSSSFMGGSPTISRLLGQGLISNSILTQNITLTSIDAISNSVIGKLTSCKDVSLFNANTLNATHLKENYTKQFFQDTNGTHKISYIDATNTIQYALPTD